MVKLANKNFILINEIKETILSEKELKESLDNLNNYINEINFDIFNTKQKNEQSFFIKILYELSLFYYFKKDNKKSKTISKSLVNYYDIYIKKYPNDINKNTQNKIFYFDIKNVKALINYFEKEENKNDNNMIIDISLNNIFNEDEINSPDKIIQEDISNYKIDLEKTKKNYKEKLQQTSINSLNEIDIKNKNCTPSFLNCLKICEYLCYKSSTEYTHYPIAFDYINSLQNKLDEKIKYNNNRKDDNDLQYIKDEIFFISHLLSLINKVNNNKEKLDKSFLMELAKFISEKKLTDNLRLSGLLHCYIINFNQNVKRTCLYFSKFVEFFSDKTNIYKDETINQIIFIDKITKIIYEVMEAKNKLSPPLVKESSINFDEKFHLSLIKIFLYWLSPKDDIDIDENKKLIQNQTQKRKRLKFLP